LESLDATSDYQGESHSSYGSKILLRSEIPSGMCSKLRTAAASNNGDHASQSLCVRQSSCSIVHTLISAELSRRNLSYYCLLAPLIYIFVLLAHPVRGESHNQRNATGEVATKPGVLKRINDGMACWMLSRGDQPRFLKDNVVQNTYKSFMSSTTKARSPLVVCSTCILIFRNK